MDAPVAQFNCFSKTINVNELDKDGNQKIKHPSANRILLKKKKSSKTFDNSKEVKKVIKIKRLKSASQYNNEQSVQQ